MGEEIVDNITIYQLNESLSGNIWMYEIWSHVLSNVQGSPASFSFLLSLWSSLSQSYLRCDLFFLLMKKKMTATRMTTATRAPITMGTIIPSPSVRTISGTLRRTVNTTLSLPLLLKLTLLWEETQGLQSYPRYLILPSIFIPLSTGRGKSSRTITFSSARSVMGMVASRTEMSSPRLWYLMS